jgi:hypothetical protein
LSANKADEWGGGVYTNGTTNLYSVTLAQNRADADGNTSGGAGGVYIYPSTTFNVINTLIVTNFTGLGSSYSDCLGTLASYGGLRLGTAAGCTITGPGGHGLVTVSSIGPLAYNGGPTQTHALLAGSEAINAADPTLGCIDWSYLQLPTDQRGAARYVGAWCDSGAFEYGANAPIPRIWVPLVIK